MYHPSCCVPTVSLPELTEVVSNLVLRTHRLLVLEDLNIHAKAALTGAAQDFMAAMTIMGLSQYVIGSTHEKGHTLDLVFSTGLEGGGLDVEGLVVTSLSWSDHFLVKFSLLASSPLCKGGGSIKMIRPRRLMDPDGFLNALGDYPFDMVGAPVEAQVTLWNRDMSQAVDTIAPKHPLPARRAQTAPWYTSELRAMKREGRRLECRWRKSHWESD